MYNDSRSFVAQAQVSQRPNSHHKAGRSPDKRSGRRQQVTKCIRAVLASAGNQTAKYVGGPPTKSLVLALCIVVVLVVGSCSCDTCGCAQFIRMHSTRPQEFFLDINNRGLDQQVHEVFSFREEPYFGTSMVCDADSCRWLGLDNTRMALRHTEIRAIRFHSRSDAVSRQVRDYLMFGSFSVLPSLGLYASNPERDIQQDRALLATAGLKLGIMAVGLASSFLSHSENDTDPRSCAYTSFMFYGGTDFEIALRNRVRALPLARVSSR